ncbi:signal recognition particle-docking protein FtsY [Natranaerobius trueperi]|uniref:Signal recognition particle receptor FtsY n=1 Tax=Natranaerobius trueperi TaxID=759412 RepID=A0A226BYS9_9FIRM|nr:signal recognition particle-docking protein FtsY [Natranaerobius trueperi]OWZ84198.1 signal recognition particle-docking protein FtsY [Natranaerobius trueperi]
MGIFSKIKEGLKKTRKGFVSQITNLFSSSSSIDEEFFEELEDILIGADVGVDTTMKIVEQIKERINEEKIKDPQDVDEILKEEVLNMLHFDSDEREVDDSLKVTLIVGVNGAGKTTSIGKLANRYKQNDQKVLLAAADTFRAAAIDQLKIWGDRVGVDVIRHQEGSDPAAVVYDGLQAARARKVDHLICDTAGRLHNKKNLMDELNKISRVIDRELGHPPHEVLLVLDATTGQNALNQAKLFSEVTPVSGIVLTKLDGTAKGGIVLALADELKLPIKYIGVGEGINDLQDFVSEQFVDALFSNSEDLTEN